MSSIKNVVTQILIAIIIMIALFFCLFRTTGHTKVYERVIIIGVDGAGSFFKDVEAECFNSIFESNNITYTMKTEIPTISAQCWGSMIYGVPHDVHGLTNAIVEKEEFHSSQLNSIFKVACSRYPEASIASIVGWSPINYGIIDCKDEMYLYPDIPGDHFMDCHEVLKNVIDYLQINDPKLMFVHFDDVDHAGHAFGWGSEEYKSALLEVDQCIGTIWDTLKNKGLIENSLFVLIADHGGTGKTHGGDTEEEVNVVFAVSGEGLNDKDSIGEMTIEDVYAVVLNALGIDNDWQVGTIPAGLFQ